jgi:hypothetical protein
MKMNFKTGMPKTLVAIAVAAIIVICGIPAASPAISGMGAGTHAEGQQVLADNPWLATPMGN